MKVVELKTYAAESKEDVVNTLEELLADAKAGNIESLAYVRSNIDGTVENGWSQTPDFYRLLSGVVVLQHRMIENRRIEDD